MVEIDIKVSVHSGIYFLVCNFFHCCFCFSIFFHYLCIMFSLLICLFCSLFMLSDSSICF